MVSKEDVKRIAHLARITLSVKEVVGFQKDFSAILAYFDTLKKADLKNVEPMTHSVTAENVVRLDKSVKASVDLKVKLGKMFAETEKGFVKVKAVLK